MPWMMMISMIMIIAAISMCIVKHPMTMGLILLIQTIFIALTTGLMSLNFWPSYIISLIMIGGILILFTYMTSIASNEKFKLSPKMMLFVTSMTSLALMIHLMMDKFIISMKLKTSNFMIKETQMIDYLFLNKFLNYPHMMIYSIMIIFLLISLIAVVKMTLKNKGTLRQKF